SSKRSSWPSIQPQHSAASIASSLLIVRAGAPALASLSQNPFASTEASDMWASISAITVKARIGSLRAFMSLGLTTGGIAEAFDQLLARDGVKFERIHEMIAGEIL